MRRLWAVELWREVERDLTCREGEVPTFKFLSSFEIYLIAEFDLNPLFLTILAYLTPPPPFFNNLPYAITTYPMFAD